jgi:pSer/pThr/pTyr-binding forkhead associated (FHA) protein
MSEGTTHNGGGRPRLVLSLGGSVELPAGAGPVVQPEFALDTDRVVIGGGPDADLRLDGLDAVHAEIWHDENDDYVVVDRARSHATRVDGDPVVERALHTGDRIELGPYTLVFVRDERADHLRPYGGRQGGELAVQEAQPPPA